MMESRYIVDKQATAKKLCEVVVKEVLGLDSIFDEELYQQIEKTSVHWDMDYIMKAVRDKDVSPVFEKEQAIHQTMKQTVRVLIINFLTDHLGEQFTYMEIAHKLVASDNTVYQTMHRMINEGSPIVCVRVSGKSNLYSIPNDKPVFGEGA
tara:strand:- start:1029 stop:1481 length:453 start_codon:yes stop_codon:yes gene_type:complete